MATWGCFLGTRTALLERPLQQKWWPLTPSWGLKRGHPAWQTNSVGHGFVWEGNRHVLHCDAVHDGGEGVQVVGVCRVGCKQMI